MGMHTPCTGDHPHDQHPHLRQVHRVEMCSSQSELRRASKAAPLHTMLSMSNSIAYSINAAPWPWPTAASPGVLGEHLCLEEREVPWMLAPAMMSNFGEFTHDDEITATHQLSHGASSALLATVATVREGATGAQRSGMMHATPVAASSAAQAHVHAVLLPPRTHSSGGICMESVGARATSLRHWISEVRITSTTKHRQSAKLRPLASATCRNWSLP